MRGNSGLGGLNKFSCYPNQRGVMLIEALVAVLVFIVGVLGIIGLQAKMVTNVSETKYRSDAAYLANQIVGQMWVDQANLAQYDSTSTGSYAKRDNWRAAVGSVLPAGTATITIGANNVVTVNITWQAAGQAQHRHTLSTQVQGRI